MSHEKFLVVGGYGTKQKTIFLHGEDAMTYLNEKRNRRKFPRFRTERELFVLHSDFGRIEEIGIGGMAFTYVEKNGPKNDQRKKGTLFSKEDDYLLELPLKTISDHIVCQSTSGKLNIRKRVVVFDDLERKEVDQLERFILNNANIQTKFFQQGATASPY